jgi:hypothetical protein
VSCLNRPAGSVVELHTRTIIESVRTLASYLIEAVAGRCFRRIERGDEVSQLEMATPWTLIVDSRTIGEKGSPFIVQIRELPEKKVVHHGTHKINIIGWATRDVYGIDADGFFD